jgi:hypothetical protein
MNIVKATERYEAWLGRQLTLLDDGLQLKHREMAADVFPFLRATYYRWAQLCPGVCEAAARGRKVLAVGDLHVENFGTWRDVEGRLIWGVNDFDEACTMPWPYDLIRLATSALLAVSAAGAFVCNTILKGYTGALEVGGRPLALAEHHSALRTMASHRLHDPEKFWAKLHGLTAVTGKVPPVALKALTRMLPEPGIECRIVNRTAGLGSLGRQRFAALAVWRGGSIAREAKALAPSAWLWANGKSGDADRIRYQDLLDTAVRCPDPFVRLKSRWIVRRLAPDCSRIELYALPGERDEERLLFAMGWETANIHLGSASARALLAEVKKRPAGWLPESARAMRQAVTADWKEWQAAYRPS